MHIPSKNEYIYIYIYIYKGFYKNRCIYFSIKDKKFLRKCNEISKKLAISKKKNLIVNLCTIKNI